MRLVLVFEKMFVVVVWKRGGRKVRVSDRRVRRLLFSLGKDMVVIGCKLVEGEMER